jgi:intein/homing endonuclease
MGMKTVVERQSAHASVQAALLGGIDPLAERRMVLEYKEADVILVPSRFVEDSFVKADPGLKQKLRRIPLGVDLEKFKRISHLKHEFRLLFVASNFDRKGGIYLVKAWQTARSESRAVRQGVLWIVGDCPRGDMGPGVRPLGSLAEEEYVRTVMDCDALVLPSLEDGFGLVCVGPETPVFTQNGLVPISRIKEGDHVLSHSGRFRKVLHSFRRQHSGEYCEISLWGLNTLVRITPNHPMLGVKRVKKRYGKYGRRWDLAPLEWIPASEVEVGDAIHFPNLRQLLGPRITYDLASFGDRSDDFFVWNDKGFSPKTGTLAKVRRITELDEGLADFLGWYVAEGYGHAGTFNFALNIDEMDMANTLSKTSENRFGIEMKTRYQKGHSITVSGCSEVVARFLEEICGQGAENKRVPAEVLYNRDLSILDRFISAYFNGDGTRRERGWSACTVSERLAGDLTMALIRLGRKPALYRVVRDASRRLTTAVTYRNQNSNFRHSNKSWTTALGDLIFLVKTKRIKTGELEVFNLEVETDNSYVTMAGTVHNCLEAMAAGKPVIVSENVGAKDCILDEREGYIVPPGETGKLSKAIVSLASSPERRLEMGEQAHRTATKFTWEKYASNYLELIRSLL